MGGNATKQWNTERFSKQEYQDVCNYIAKILNLSPLFSSNEESKDYADDYVLRQTLSDENGDELYAFIPCYFEKDSFGDLDLLTTNNHVAVIAMLKKADDVEVVGKVKGGNCTSYAIRFKSISPKAFQLDIIHTDVVFFDFALHYFAFNDLGNFIGRIASAAQLKFGFDGLYRKVHFNKDMNVIPVYSLKEQKEKFGDLSSNVVKKTDVVLTEDFLEALEFLGFDVERYKKGFATLEEIFEFVWQSKYFQQSYFLLENRPADVRARDKKRANYNLAVEYFAKKGEKQTLDFISDEKVNHQFPSLLELLSRLQAKLKHQALIKSSVTPKHVAEALLSKNIELAMNNGISLTQKILGNGDNIQVDNQHNAIASHVVLGKLLEALHNNQLVKDGYFVNHQNQDELKQLILTEFELLRVNYSSGVY